MKATRVRDHRVTTTEPLRPLPTGRSGFPVEDLSKLLDGAHREIRVATRRVLATLERPRDPTRDEYREIVLEWARTLADHGIGRLGLPAPYGPGDPAAFIAALGELAHFDLSLLTKAGVQFGLFAGAIARMGTALHHEAYLEDAGSLALPGCFAMTETGHGSNVRDLETTAVYDPDGDRIIIDTPHALARKDYIGNAARHGRSAVVFARLLVNETDHGVHAIVVPIRDQSGGTLPGVRIEDDGDKEGLNGVDNGRIWFESVPVPRGDLLDRFASIDDRGRYHSPIEDPEKRFFTMIGTLVGGRIAVGAAAVSVAKSALTIAVRYANRRRQFGPDGAEEWSLIDYPLHRMRLMPRLATAYAYHFAFEEIVATYRRESFDRELETTAAGLKAFSTWHALDTVQAAREATGGQGYLTVNRLGSMRADADVLTTFEGDNNVLVQLVARSLVGDLRRKLATPGSRIAYLSRRGLRRLVEATPVTRARALGRRLDSARLRGLLREREAHALDGLARRLRSRLADGVDAFDAFADVQHHALAVSRSHVERVVYESFSRSAAKAGELGETLQRLAALYAAGRIEADLGWFLEHRVLAQAGASRIRRLVERLSAEIAGESLALVDAFGIPDRVLGAPIGLPAAT